MFEVLIVNSQIREDNPIIYQGKCSSVFIPGADGELEVLDFHKPMMTKLKKGFIVVDNKEELLIRDGIVKMDRQRLIAIVELQQ